jgi:predicted DNA-binding transcriptional regulator YafY
MRIDRMLSITVMLLNRERIPAKELADKFEVSVRTIYRDIDAINMAGIPIVSYQGNSGGFGIMPNYKLERQLLTFDSMVSILSALKGVNQTLGDESIDGAIEKITSLVPKEKADDLHSMTERIVMDILPWGSSRRQRENLQLVHAAIAANKLVEFDYLSDNGSIVNRSVEPMTLVFKGYAWYLFGYCLVRKDFRLFRLTRMRELAILDDSFNRKNVSYRDYIKKLFRVRVRKLH